MKKEDKYLYFAISVTIAITRYGWYCVGLDESKEPFFVPYEDATGQ